MSEFREPVAPSDLRPPADDAEARTLLLEGVIDVEGRMLDASNVTLVGTIRTGTLEAECIYKPVAGERPLWDFPDGTLAGREISAFLVSQASGWRVVPPTERPLRQLSRDPVPRSCRSIRPPSSRCCATASSRSWAG